MHKKRKIKSKISKLPRKNKSFNWRIKALFLVFVLAGGALVSRLYFLQIMEGDYYSALALGQKVELEGSILRGDIYFQDNAGNDRFLAATNKESFLVYADPKIIEDEATILNEVSRAINIPEEKIDLILSRLSNKNSSYALIARNLTEEQSEDIRDLLLPGIYIRAESNRFYPADKVGSHVLGFLGFSGEKRSGQYGIEEYYDDILSGNTSSGFLFSNLFSSELKDSADIELTIDYGIQFAVEKKLKELVTNLDADSGTVIFMEPKTGSIIAMANYPSFNPNTYNEIKDISIFTNNAVHSVFELGSVFKPITMAAAIDGGAITPQTVYEDLGKLKISGYTIRNSDGKAYELQTMTEVLEKSLNTGAVFAQQELGKKKFKKYLEDFDLDKQTGVDLPGEVFGNIDNVKNTNIDINFATASFGQGISFSPLRFLASLSAIANNGVIMKPHLVKKIIFSEKEIEIKPEKISSPISSMTASRITAMMVGVVENGYGSKAAIPGYSVAGKTGTAQVPNKNGPGYSQETIHSFVGFAPAYDPKFIGIIKVDNPKTVRFSADSVTPVFGDMASFILQYYKIPPQ